MEAATAAVASSRAYRPTATSVGTVLALRSITLENEVAGTVRRVGAHAGADRRAGTAAGRPRRLRRRGRAGGAEGAGGAGADHADPAGDAEQPRRGRPGRGRSGAGRARRRPGPGGPDPRGHRAEDDPGAVPRPGRHRRRAPRPVPQRGHPAHHAPGRGRAGQRGLHRGPADRRRAPGGRRGRDRDRPAMASPAVGARITAIDARVDPTTRNAMVRAEIKGTRNLPTPGASVRVKVPAGPAGQGGRHSGERPAQGSERRSRVRDPARQGRASSAPTSARCGPARRWATRS